MPHMSGRLISIKYAAFFNRENRAKFLISEKWAVLSTPLLPQLSLEDTLTLSQPAMF